MDRSWTRLAGAVLLLVAAASPQAAPPRSDASIATLTHLRKPLLFEANRGQTIARGDFVAYGPDYIVALAGGRITLSSAAGDVVRIAFIGARTPKARPLDQQPARVGYEMRGGGRIADIPVYGRVMYPDTYPGIGVVFYGHHGELEFDLELAPGISPSAVRLGITGADAVRVDADGALRLLVTGDEIRIDPPILYDSDDQTQIAASASYVLDSPGECSIVLAPFDPGRRASADH